MKIKLNRAPVFLQLVAHRERWRWRSGTFTFPRYDAGGIVWEREGLKSILKHGNNLQQRQSGRGLSVSNAGAATTARGYLNLFY